MTGEKSKKNLPALTRAEKVVLSLIPNDPKYGRNVLVAATERLAKKRGFKDVADAYAEWVERDEKNEFAHWTKNFTKLLQPEAKDAEEDAYARAVRMLDAKIVDAEVVEISPDEPDVDTTEKSD